MLTGGNGLSAPVVKAEGPFPLGPFPRHIWIHHNTPHDSLDKACHEIWKRVQGLSEELQPTSLPPPLQPAFHSNLSEAPKRDGSNSQNEDQLLDETEGLQSIYRTMIGNREREMKLRALCDAQLSAKSIITGTLCTPKSHKNSKGLEDGSTTGIHRTEGSRSAVPFLPKHTDIAKSPDNRETKAVKEFIQNSMFSSARNNAAVPSSPTTAAESQAAGQKQQLPVFAKICSKTDSDVVTEALQAPVTTATLDRKNKYNANTFTPHFSTTSATTTLNQPMWLSLSFPPPPVFPNHSNFPQFQGLYHQRARIPYQQALHPSFGCYSRQVTPYSPQQIFRSPYAPLLNYMPLVQPGYSYQQRTPPKLSSNARDPSAMAGDGPQYPFSPSYGFSSTPGGAMRTNPYYSSSGSCVNF
nr:PREDICTED: uncharacterized protein C1orf94 homolog [Apteryx mantelli mantelli]